MTAAITTIRSYIRSYYDDVFQKEYFISILAFMGLIVTLNYSYPFAAINNQWLSFLFYYLLYLLPFSFAYALQWLYFKEDRAAFSKPWLWILLLSAPAIFAFRVNFNLQEIFTSNLSSAENFRFISSVINYGVKVIMLMVPVIIIWFIKDKKFLPLYGFSMHRNRKLYFSMLAFMIPLIVVAATLPDFLNTYPKAMREAGLYPAHNIPRLVFFELAYGLDFLSIEFFFRGFLIIAFIKYFGMRAIVPAACFYCCIHLGKPMAEAISSFFGGLLLGIISYHTLSIWGGLLIHLGIAWMMELATYISHHF